MDGRCVIISIEHELKCDRLVKLLLLFCTIINRVNLYNKVVEIVLTCFMLVL